MDTLFLNPDHIVSITDGTMSHCKKGSTWEVKTVTNKTFTIYGSASEIIKALKLVPQKENNQRSQPFIYKLRGD